VSSATLTHLLGRLRQLRQVHNLTQEQFAEAAGISYKYYQAIEAGRKAEMRLSTLDRLAKAYGIQVWQLLAPDLPETRPPRKNQTAASRPRRQRSR